MHDVGYAAIAHKRLHSRSVFDGPGFDRDVFDLFR